MKRAMVSKYILDEMIRARIGDAACMGVKPMPVSWRPRVGESCNWEVAGWIGEAPSVRACTERLSEYLRSLRSQFDIPDEG